MPETTLYADSSEARFFLIPDDARLPKGKLVLRSLSGTRLDVDEQAAKPYEIGEDEAQQAAAAEMERLASKARGMLSGIGGVLRQVADNQRNPEYRPPERSPRETTVADALGVTEEQLRNDPEAVAEGVKQVLEGLRRSVADALTQGPAEDEDTKARIRALAQAVGTDPDDTEATLDQFREKLRSALSSPELEARVREATERLDAISAELRGRKED